MSQMPALIKAATGFGHLLLQNTAHGGLTTNFSSYTNKNSNCSTTGLFLSYVTFQTCQGKENKKVREKREGKRERVEKECEKDSKWRSIPSLLWVQEIKFISSWNARNSIFKKIQHNIFPEKTGRKKNMKKSFIFLFIYLNIKHLISKHQK